MLDKSNGHAPLIATMDNRTAERIQKALRDDGAAEQSMQARANREYPAWVFFGYSLFQGIYQRTKDSDVAPWGYAQRDLHLRTFFYLAGNNYVQTAESIMQQKVQSTDYTIEGPERTAGYVRDLTTGSEFGRGFYEFTAKFIKDYDTCDNGVFVELIGAGDPGEPLQGRVQGIAVMDSLRCQRTGMIDYPVIYYGDGGEQHKIHRSRVWFASDMPSTDERMFGYGFCSLSRAVSQAQTQILWAAYRNEWLDDRFPNGLLALNNINLEYWQNLLTEHRLGQESKDKTVFSQVMPVPSMDPQQPVSIEYIPFRQIWEGFDQKMLADLAIDDVAMAWGLDHQDLAPLATSSMGSGAQSTVLDQKARGKGPGNRLQLIERFMNDITPTSVTFKFDMTDDAQDLQQAQIRETKTRTVISLYSTQQPPAAGFYGEIQSTLGTTSLITRDEGRQILAKEIPEWSEILNPVPEDEEGPKVQFADVMAQKWYGPKVRIRKNGDMKVIEPRRKALPVIAEVSDDEIVKARAYLADMGITFEPQKKYDPSQPRDDGGQWSETGAGGGDSVSRLINQMSPEQRARVLASLGHSPTPAAAPKPSGKPSAKPKPASKPRSAAQQQWEGRIHDSDEAVSAIEESTGRSVYDFLSASGADSIPADKFNKTRVRMGAEFHENGKIKTVAVTIGENGGKVDMERHFNFDENGKPDHIYNAHFYLDKSQQGTGLGTKVFKSQADEAAKMGFKSIITYAGKSKTMNGYYTWPRLGYDARVDVDGKKMRLSDLMRTKAGRDYWKANGKDMEMEFSLSKRGRSRKILDAYYAERFGAQ